MSPGREDMEDFDEENAGVQVLSEESEDEGMTATT
jgi:hypothetical protein